MKILPMMLAGLFLSAACLVSSAQADDKKIYLLHGPRSHGVGEHEFRAGSILLARALNEQSGLPVQAVVHAGWPKDDTMLDDADAIFIFSDATRVVQHGWEKMDALMKQGVGCMFMHYAVHPDTANGNRYFVPWMGGFFETGHSVNPHWIADLEGKAGHPVSRGIEFPVRCLDEFYYHMRFPEVEGKREALITAVPQKNNFFRIINLWNRNGVDGVGKPQTLMWGFERPGGGRGVGFTGGHYHRNFAIDGFRTAVLNALAWVAKLEVPEGGVPSLPVSEEQLNENLDGTPSKPLTIPTELELNSLKRCSFVTFDEAGNRVNEAQ